MAKVETIVGKKKTTLWEVVISFVGYGFWIGVYFPVWFALFVLLMLLGWDTKSAVNFWVIVISLGALPVTWILSDAFSRFKEWAKRIEMFY